MNISPLKDTNNFQNNESPYSKYFLQLSPVVDQEEFYSNNEIDLILKQGDRSINETLLLYKQLKSFLFFKQFQLENPKLRFKEALIYLTRILKYEHFRAGTTIYRKGEMSNQKVYLVYSGKLSAYNGNPNPFRFLDVKTSSNLDEEKIERPLSSKPQKRSETDGPVGFKGMKRQETISEGQQKKNPKLFSKSKIFKLLPGDNILTTPEFQNKTNRDLQNKHEVIPVSQFDEVDVVQIQQKKFQAFITAYRLNKRNASRLQRNKRPTSSQLGEDTESRPTPRSFRSNPADVKVSLPSTISLHNVSDITDEKTPISDTSSVSFGNSMEEEKPQRLIRRILEKERHFGEKSLAIRCPREETVTALTDCELLSFTEDDYKYILNRFHNDNGSVMNFLLDSIPGLEKASKYKKFDGLESYFEEQIYSLRKPIITEGSQGTKVFLLYKGFCEVIKETRPPQKPFSNGFLTKRNSNSLLSKTTICLIRPGMFIGEEVLFKDNGGYEQTVKSASYKTKILSIEAAVFKKVMPEEVLEELNVLYLNKKQHNEELLSKKIKTSYGIQKQGSLDFSCTSDENSDQRSLKGNIKRYFVKGKNNFTYRNDSEMSSFRTDYDPISEKTDPHISNLHDLRRCWNLISLKRGKCKENSFSVRLSKEKSTFANKPYFENIVQERGKMLEGNSSLINILKYTHKNKELPEIVSAQNNRQKEKKVHSMVIDHLLPKNKKRIFSSHQTKHRILSLSGLNGSNIGEKDSQRCELPCKEYQDEQKMINNLISFRSPKISASDNTPKENRKITGINNIYSNYPQNLVLKENQSDMEANFTKRNNILTPYSLVNLCGFGYVKKVKKRSDKEPLKLLRKRSKGRTPEDKSF